MALTRVKEKREPIICWYCMREKLMSQEGYLEDDPEIPRYYEIENCKICNEKRRKRMLLHGN